MIYLVRHGESTSNVGKRFTGITDVDLSPFGMKQAYKAGISLKEYKVSRIYTSPLKRAFDTAKVISELLNKDITIIKSLIEVNFGIFENMTWEEMTVSYKEETDNWIRLGNKYKFPEGESYEDIINRIKDFLDNIDDGSVIVTHFGVIQSILLYLKIADDNNLWKYNISNCDIIVLNNKKIEKIIKCIT